MRFTFDPARNEKNIAERGLSFALAAELDWERPNADNPEWTREDMAKARPAAEVLPVLIGVKATEKLFRRGRGRPPKAVRKVNQPIRLDPEVLAACQREGRGWQTRINSVLREHLPGRQK